MSSMPPSSSGAMRDDADVRRASLNLAQQVTGVEIGRRRVGDQRAPSGRRAPRAGCGDMPPGWAPRYSGLRKLLSRWAGSTRAACGDGIALTSRTCSSIVRSAAGVQAVVVGQNAVTPYRGIRAAICSNHAGSAERVHAFEAVHVHVDKTRDDEVIVKQRRRFCPGTGPNIGDVLAFNHQRARRQQTIGQHERGAGEDYRQRAGCLSRSAPRQLVSRLGDWLSCLSSPVHSDAPCPATAGQDPEASGRRATPRRRDAAAAECQRPAETRPYASSDRPQSVCA